MSNTIVIFDLDGTLVEESKYIEIYKKVFEEACKIYSEKNNSVFDFNCWPKTLSCEEFRELFKKLYSKEIESVDFSKNRKRISEIMGFLTTRYGNIPEKFYVVSANPCSDKILEKINFPKANIVSIFDEIHKELIETIEEYYEKYIEIKAKKLQEIKNSNKNKKFVYIGDTEYDERIANIVGFDFINIKDLFNYVVNHQ